jgi:hypothetical protein
VGPDGVARGIIHVGILRTFFVAAVSCHTDQTNGGNATYTSANANTNFLIGNVACDDSRIGKVVLAAVVASIVAVSGGR